MTTAGTHQHGPCHGGSHLCAGEEVAPQVAGARPPRHIPHCEAGGVLRVLHVLHVEPCVEDCFMS